MGEGSHLPSFDWSQAYTLDGSTHLMKEADALNKAYSGNVVLACLENDSPGWTIRWKRSNSSPWDSTWVWVRSVRMDSIEIAGETLGNLQSHWKPARLTG
ncbi:MAG: hypothetical protein V2B15_02765 [Bacteroidota bacterium]